MFTINGNNIQATLISSAYKKAAAYVSNFAFPITKLKQHIDDFFYKPQTVFDTGEYIPEKEVSTHASIMCNNTHSAMLSDLIQNGIKDYSNEVETIFKSNLEHLPLNLFTFIQSFFDFCENFDSVQGLITDEETSVIKSMQEYVYQAFSDCEQENSTEDLIKLLKFKNDLLDFNESVDKWLEIFCNIRMETPIDAITNLTDSLKNIKRRILPLLHSIDTTSTYCFEYLPPLPMNHIIRVINEMYEVYLQIDGNNEAFSDIKAELENATQTFAFVFQNSRNELNILHNADVFYSKVDELTTKLNNFNDEEGSPCLNLEKLNTLAFEFYEQYEFLYNQTLKIDLKINQEQIKETISNFQSIKDLYNNTLVNLCSDISTPKEILANIELTNKHLNKEQFGTINEINNSIDTLINKTEFESLSFEPLLVLLHDFQEFYKDKDSYKQSLINKAIDLTTILNEKQEVNQEFRLQLSQLYLIIKMVLSTFEEAILCENETNDAETNDASENSTLTKKMHTELKSICRIFESVYLEEQEKNVQFLNKTLSKGAFPALEQLDFIKNISMMERLSFYNAIDSNRELKFSPSPIAFSIKTFTAHEMLDFFELVIYKFDRVTKALNQTHAKGETEKSDIKTPVLSKEIVRDFQRLWVICSKINDSEIKLLETTEQIAIEQRLELFKHAVGSIKNTEILRQLFTNLISVS